MPGCLPLAASTRVGFDQAAAVLLEETATDPRKRRQTAGPFLPVSPPLFAGKHLVLAGLSELIRLDPATLEVVSRDPGARLSNEGAAVLPDGRVACVTVGGDRLVTAEGQELYAAPGRICSNIALSADGKPVVGVAPDLIQVVGGPTCQVPRAAQQTPECDRALALATSRERIVGLTRDGRVVAFGTDGCLSWCVQESMSWPRVPPIFSPDGATVYVSSVHGAVVALDARDGRERWRLALDPKDNYCVTPPALDEHGNLHLYTQGSTILRISPEGRLLHRIPTGTRYYVSMGYRAQLELDRLGNLVVTANPDETLVFAPEGHRRMRLATEELFDGMGEFVDSFALSPERDRAIILSGSRGIAEVELPRTPGEVRDALRAAIASREADGSGPRVGVRDGWVTVGSTRLRRRRLEA
ncbi:MAG: PQQ-binding-like beta-propeller repeat protein [Candidatus Eremiobacterota bacterium]